MFSALCPDLAAAQIADRRREADNARLARSVQTPTGRRRRLVVGWKLWRPSFVVSSRGIRSA
jgi:hypothetical protein